MTCLQIVVHGDGFKEWNLTIPTREGATAADAIKELQNAVSFELRSHDLMKKTIVVPNSALWRDISTHLTHGYYLFAHGTDSSIYLLFLLGSWTSRMWTNTSSRVIRPACQAAVSALDHNWHTAGARAVKMGSTE